MLDETGIISGEIAVDVCGVYYFTKSRDGTELRGILKHGIVPSILASEFDNPIDIAADNGAVYFTIAGGHDIILDGKVESVPVLSCKMRSIGELRQSVLKLIALNTGQDNSLISELHATEKQLENFHEEGDPYRSRGKNTHQKGSRDHRPYT